MEAKDLPRIEQLFHTALEMDVAERARYLARECADEEEVRSEVESLMAVFEKQANFLETPVFNEGLKALSADSSESLTGKLIGSYKVERLLGKGGMGEVYLAEDTRLGRLVALKFLARHLAADNWARRQLVKEAQAVARLDHPNICAVHGLEEADGHSFIVMQYVDGEALSDLICTERLEAKQAVPLALQMVGALAEAHAHGIIHRDIKPQNLMLTAGGQLKVLDFGLAKVVQGKLGVDGQSQASQKELIAGTVAYMSPEQLCAKRLDFRSDIFSVGTALYELVSGKHPFARENDAETIAAILNDEPAELPHRVKSFAPGLERVIRKCLEKDKERRYPSASALLLDLQSIQSRSAPRWPRPRLNPFVTAVLFVLIVAGALLAYSRLTTAPTLAVLPFTNEGAGSELDYLVAGLPDSLANQLSKLSRIRVKAPSVVSGAKNGQVADLRGIGRELGTDTVLVGKATAQGETVLLQVQLVNVANASQLWAKSYNVKQTDPLALQDLIAAEVATTLGSQLSAEEETLLQTGHTRKTEAFREYLQGRYYWNRRSKENIQLAITHFQKATEIDQEYARAYSGLADSYVLLTSVVYGQAQTQEAMTNARVAATLALKIDPTLSEAHTSIGVIKLKYDWNWQEANAEFERAIELNPNYAPAHYWLSNLLFVVGQGGGALAESEIARMIEPFSPSVNNARCRARYWTRQFESAAKCYNEMLERDPSNSNAQYTLGFIYLAQGRTEQALEIFQKMYAIKEKEAFVISALGHTYGRLGRKDDALRILARAQELAQSANLPPQEIAIIYVGLGDRDQAFAWLNKAAEKRFAYLIYLNVEPIFDSLRADPRYADLARRINLQPPVT
jgi:eukaryotic-like serine/threonine-protein kinase